MSLKTGARGTRNAGSGRLEAGCKVCGQLLFGASATRIKNVVTLLNASVSKAAEFRD